MSTWKDLTRRNSFRFAKSIHKIHNSTPKIYLVRCFDPMNATKRSNQETEVLKLNGSKILNTSVLFTSLTDRQIITNIKISLLIMWVRIKNLNLKCHFFRNEYSVLQNRQVTMQKYTQNFYGCCETFQLPV